MNEAGGNRCDWSKAEERAPARLVEIVVIIMCKRRSRASSEQLNWNGEDRGLPAGFSRANLSCLSSYNNYYIHREVDQARIKQYYYFFLLSPYLPIHLSFSPRLSPLLSLASRHLQTESTSHERTARGA